MRTFLSSKVAMTLALAASTALVGCVQSDENADDTARRVSVNSDGSCTARFVANYNEVVNANLTLKTLIDSETALLSEKLSALSEIDRTCDVFHSTHKDQSCVLKLSETGPAKMSWSALRAKCGDAKALLNKFNEAKHSPNGKVVTKPKAATEAPKKSVPQKSVVAIAEVIPSVGDDTPVADLKAEAIELVIVDDQAAKLSLKSGGEQVIAHGKIGTADELAPQLSSTDSMCFLVSQEPQKDEAVLLKNAVLKLETVSEGSPDGAHYVAGLKSVDGPMLGCTRLDGDHLTFGDVRNAVSGIIELRLTK